MRRVWDHRWGFIGIVVLLNLAVLIWDYRADMTADQRYSISTESRQILEWVPEDVVITVLLEGKLPAIFRTYRDYIDHMLRELRRIKPNITVVYKDPSRGSAEEVNSFRNFLSSSGVNPVSRRVASSDEVSQSLIYPFISLHDGQVLTFVDLLEPKKPSQTEEEAILASILSFEEKVIRGIRTLSMQRQKRVGVVAGKAIQLGTYFSRERLLSAYQWIDVGFDTGNAPPDSLDAILVMLRGEDISRKQLLWIDQMALRGIPVVWAVDKFDVAVDSIGRYGSYTSIASSFRAEDLFFSWGIKVMPALIMDLQCAGIPQIVGNEGGQPKTVVMAYPFYPVLGGQQNHPISRPIKDAFFRFASYIDTIQPLAEVRRTNFLLTSPYTKTISSPAELSFDFMRVDPNPEEYVQGPLSLAMMVDGQSPSYFRNRLTSEDRSALSDWSVEFVESAEGINHVIFPDTDFILPMKSADGNFFPVGFNKWDRNSYDGGTQLLANVLEFLLEGDDLLSIVRTSSELSILDVSQLRERRGTYMLIVFGFPIVFIVFLALILSYLRKRRYGWVRKT
jgi:gliding-associated putative ABC transporter substrate-binding component GldG